MNELSNKYRLKDKFSKLEIAIEDDDISYKITSESLKNIKPISESSKKPNVFKLAFRLMKLAAITFYEILEFIYKGFVSKIFFYSFGKSKKILITLREKEEKAELFFDEKITRLEIIKQEQKEAEELNFLNMKMMTEEYSAGIQVLFRDLVDSNDFRVPQADNEQLKSIIGIQMKLMELSSRKLVVSNMIVNIKKIKIKTYIEGMDLINSLNFELDKKGHLWTKMFGKNIVPEINSLIEGHHGEVNLKQVYNFSTKKDLVFLRIKLKIPTEERKEQTRGSKAMKDIPNDKIFNEYRL